MPEADVNAPMSRNSGMTANERSVTVRMGDNATSRNAGFRPLIMAKPATPTRPMATPMGTRRAISVNRTTKARIERVVGFSTGASLLRYGGLVHHERFGSLFRNRLRV